MRILGAQLRGVLVPVGVAVAFILALAWYGFYWIPAQQRYLNESNLRVLRTMSAQIKARVDNFDQAIDHAIDSFPTSIEGTAFQDYVRAFAPDLEILNKPKVAPVDHQGVEHLVFRRAGDPPRVVVRRDEGRNFLYLGYYHEDDHPVTVIARSDIENVAAPFLAAGNRFDAVLLVDRVGRVIAQKSQSGLGLARVDSLVENDFERFRTASHIKDVQLGDAPFKLYLQPIQLSMNRAEELAAKEGKDRDEPEEWALCGLVRADHFRADSSAISYTYVIWFSALLALLFVAIPLLKLQVLSPRERLRGTDGTLIAMSTFLAAALLTFCVTDGYFAADLFRSTTDQQLKKLADAFKRNLTDEFANIRSQQDFLDDARAWEHLDYDHSLAYYRENPPGKETDSGPRLRVGPGQAGDRSSRDAYREALLAHLPPALLPYPFFERVIWYDANGWERIKWTTRKRVTPFINLKEAQLLHYDDLIRVVPPSNGVEVIQSPTTGQTVTVFWRTAERKSKLAGQWMSMATPLSLRQPVLPPGVRFAVVDPDGLVLFHSDSTRSLKENFFEETEHDPALEAAARGQYDDVATADYEGRRHRFHVTPVDAALATTTTRPWSLIVFQDARVPETVNLETLTLAGGLFAVYAAILAGVWAGAFVFWTGYPAKWFWPDRPKATAYRRVAVTNALLAAVGVGLALIVESTSLIIGTVALAFAGLAATFAILTQDRSQGTTPDDLRWHHSFCWARVSLLAILAVVPALACFRAAYQFETRLLIGSGQASFARQLAARDRRITEEAERLPLCEGGDGCMSLKDFTDKRTSGRLDVYVEPFFETRLADAAAPARTRSPQDPALDHVLAVFHRSYNDVASELKEAIPKLDASPLLTSDMSATTALPGPVYSIALAAVIGALFLLVRYVAAGLFLLHLRRQPASEPRMTDETANVLLIGPPGCGRTARLHGNKCLRVFDLRTTPSLDPLSAGSEPIGIDHFEYGFGDPKFRDEMLPVLEGLIYRRRRTVWVAATRDAWRRVQYLPDGDRWVRVLSSFVTQNVGVDEHAVSQLGDAAEPYFEALWAGCSTEERLALRQLAEEDVVNPNNETVLQQLLQDGLIVHEATFRIMNGAFRRFVLKATPSNTVLEWEQEGVIMSWGTIRTTLMTVAVGLAGLLLLTQQQLVEAWVGYIPTLAPAVPTAMKVLASLQRGGKAAMA
jgi:hypothetical protein